MSLYRVDGWYEADFRFKDKKRLHLLMRTKKKSEAQDRYDAVRRLFREDRDAMIEQLRSGILTIEHLTRMVAEGLPLAPIATRAALDAATPAAARGTLDDVVARYIAWLEQHPNRAENTVRVNSWQARSFADFVYDGERLGARPFAKITWPMVQAYQTSLVEAGRPKNSITTLMTRVSTLWNWCQDQEAKLARQEHRAATPIYSPIDSEMIMRGSTRRERVLAPSEVERLVAATPAPLEFAVGCGVMAGLRLGEVLHLRQTIDVDLAESVLLVRDQGDVWKPKTKRSIRTVPMVPELRALAERHAKDFAAPPWMFARASDPSLPMHDLVFREHFEKIVTRAGLLYGRDDPLGVTFHTLRHTFASTALQNGVDLYTVAQLLGDSLKMVEEVYGHLSLDFKRAAVAKVAGAYNLKPEVTA
jgi:integrase